MYFDWTYVVFVLPCIIFSLIASSNVNRTFEKYAKVYASRGITGAQAAQRVLYAHGITGIRIEHISGKLTDHFDPGSNVIRLSDSVYSSSSTAAIGVACHEAGHAVQHAVGYFPIRIRSAIIPITNLGSRLAMPLILLGIALSGLSSRFYGFVYLGLLCFSLSFLFQLITLPVEFDASNRALHAIEDSDLLSNSELAGARKTLRAAAMTYVAAMAVSMAQLLRLMVMFGGGNRRSRR